MMFEIQPKMIKIHHVHGWGLQGGNFSSITFLETPTKEIMLKITFGVFLEFNVIFFLDEII